MGLYVDRDPSSGRVTDRFQNEQYPGQEHLADGGPGLIALLLADAQEKRCDDVDRLHAAKELRGVTYDGHRFELNDKSQGKIGNMALNALLSLNPATGITWDPLEFTAADNEPYWFNTALSFFPFAQAAAVLGKALFARRAELKRLCRASGTVEALAAIDITTGWPPQD